MLLPCDGVLFDVDGTLVDSTPLIERAARVWAPEYGIDPDAYLARAHGRRTSDSIADFLPAGQVRAATERLDALEAAEVAGVTALPGVVDLLSSLRGLPWAVVTSMDPGQLTARAGAAGVPLPKVAVTARDVAAGKPDPAGYLLAARRLGLDPARCVVVEDAPAGVAAGRAAGATVVALTTSHSRADLAEADVIVPDLTAVTAEPGGLRVRA
ncbi:HAD-IA family hydrolase [Actinomadura macrotermitis]|uniref:Hexitol phosphatase A n=1 Tax=Actinomadura macrotermitis TaxID=2585200 RepID=A0A7K0BNF3_9ACTN|nr:HAD-IA family hydrolase [Actinomadura macrotermitis]MQY02402.1 Hexitol phosphatase A [Actinomadura macrotermitis]